MGQLGLVLFTQEEFEEDFGALSIFQWFRLWCCCRMDRLAAWVGAGFGLRSASLCLLVKHARFKGKVFCLSV